MNKIARSHLFIFLALFLGVLSGLSSLPILIKGAEAISTMLMNFLRFIAAPIIFLSVFSTLLGFKNFGEMRTIASKVFKYTLLTTIIAATVALVLFLLIHPTKGQILREVTWDASSIQKTSYFKIITNMVPANFVGAFLHNNVIGIVLIAIFFGIASHKLPEENKIVLEKMFSALFKLFLKVTEMVTFVMPVGIWAFVTIFMKEMEQNSTSFNSLFLYLSVVLGANFIQGVIIIPILLKMKGLSPVKIFRGGSKALLFAFFTKSSNATLPLSLECASSSKHLNIHPKVAQFSLPLCTVINMNGCAAFILATVLFVSMIHGMTYTVSELILWVFLATLAAIGNAGVPMGCFFLSSAFLVGMGVPIQMLGIILPFYAFIDMIETALNVWSDIAVTALVNKEIKITSLA